jgi:hypothetical protein
MKPVPGVPTSPDDSGARAPGAPAPVAPPSQPVVDRTVPLGQAPPVAPDLPVPPLAPPPPDVPARAVWAAPSGGVVGDPVVFDGTRSEGDGPISCRWSYPSGSGPVTWATACTAEFTFTTASAKQVTLSVTDADGDTDASSKTFFVGEATAPEPAPEPEPEPKPTPAPTPAPDDAEALGPARANERDCNGASVSLVAVNNTRYIDCPGVKVPEKAKHLTIVGTQAPATVLKGVVDVYIGGRPGALMNSGPRSDGHDLLQIKRASDGTIPDGITLRWMRFHDLTREGTAHTDGIQVMAGRNGKILDSRFERVDVQPIFFRYAGASAGGGPIEDWLVARSYIQKPPTGYYAIRISGNGDALVPTRITLRDLSLTANVSVDRAAVNAGFSASGLVGGEVRVNG